MIERKRPVRSAAYQQIFNECIIDVEALNRFTNEDGLFNKLNPYSYDERVLELKDRLIDAMWRLLKETLTKRQFQIVSLLAEPNSSQQEVANKIGVNQSSVAKSLHGNKSYSQDSQVSYGGIAKKASRAFDNDEEIQSILKQIAELRDESW